MARVIKMCGVERSKAGVPCSVLVAFLVLFLVGCTNSGSESIAEGKHYLDEGKLSSAIISFKNAVQADPKMLSARLALADALERSGDLPGAEQQLRRALEFGGVQSEIFPRIAVMLLDRGENSVLIHDFALVKLESDTSNSDLKALVALAYLATKQPKKAEEQLGLVSVQTPAVHLVRAQIAFALGDRDEASKHIDVVLNSETPPWWVLRAASRVFAANDEASKALQAIKRANEIFPMHRGVIGEYAEQLIASNRKEEARPLRDSLRKIAPTYYRTQYLEALFLLDENKPDQAYTAATKVLSVVPEHVPSQIVAASIEMERNELASVDTRIRRILSAEPNSSQGYRLKASLEMRRGNLLEATRALERAISRAPEDRNLLVMAAGLSWSQGDRRTALIQMSKAALREPLRADLLANLAEMQNGFGKTDDAIQTLGSALNVAKNPKDREVVFSSALHLKQINKAKEIARNEVQFRPKDPDPLLWVAAVVGSEGDEGAALDYTRRALDLVSDFYPALVAMERTANTPERRKEYEARLQKAIESNSKEPKIYLDYSRVQAGAGADSNQIGAILEKGVEVAPENLMLRESAIKHWLTGGQKQKALALAKAGEVAQPDNPQMIALAAYVHESSGEMSQAAVRFARLSDRFPDRVDWSLKHAQYLKLAGKNEDAISVLRRLIQERPEEPLPYQALVSIQLEMGLVKDAQVTAEMLRDKPRTKALGLLLLGDVLGATDRRAEALKTYSAAALEGLPEAAVMKKVVLLDRTGGEAIATGELSKWLAVHPNSVSGLSLAAKRASDRQNYVQAAKYLEVLVKNDPKNPIALNDLAWAYVMAGDAKGMAIAEKAISLVPTNSVVLDTLSQAFVVAGRLPDALVAARKAVKEDEKNGVARVHLAELLMNEGSKQEAKNVLSGVDEKHLDKEAKIRLQKLAKQI